MRYLRQHPNCKRLKKKRDNQPSDDLSAKRAWRRFNKKDTRKACYKLQQGLCAYTELSLDSLKLGNHLEHIAPRSRFPERTFMANNLVLSVLADDYSGSLDEDERFAGHFKKSHYADDWFISPYDEDCERYFDYSAQSGEVNPATDLNKLERAKAEKTISVLNLNCDYLVNERLKQLSALAVKISALVDVIDQTLYEKNASDQLAKDSNSEQLENKLNVHKQLTSTQISNELTEKLEKLTEDTLKPIDKKLPEFYTAKKQLLQFYKQRLS